MTPRGWPWWAGLMILAAGILLIPLAQPVLAAALAQTTPLASGPQAWMGRLISNTPGYTKGGGAIFRVYVTGLEHTRIELRSDDEFIWAESGSKPEYGPYAAEFAPVTAGNWTISVPALGVSTQIVSDNYNYAVIEFLQVPAEQATQTVLPPPTATPLAGQTWQGNVAAEKFGIGANFARLLVQVAGLSGQPVRLSTLAQVINTANTGQKPTELGPDVVEFTALTPGTYIIEPLGLNARFDVTLKANTETRVEFRPQALPTVTSTLTPPPPAFTPGPPIVTPLPTDTPIPVDTAVPTGTPAPTATSPPPPTDTPVPAPTPLAEWLGVVTERQPLGTTLSTVAVKVAGVPGLPVRLRAVGENLGGERRCVTGQGMAESDMCQFEDLKPGDYVIAPEGLGLSLPVTIFEKQRVVAVFRPETLPPGIFGWQGRVLKNDNQAIATTHLDSIITVRIAGQAGQVAALRSVRGTEQFCEVRPNPVVGGLACEFGGLAPGVYLIEALHTGAGLRLFVDGASTAQVEFSPTATSTLTASPPVVGQGALPRQPTPTITPTPTTEIILPTFTPTPIPTPTRTPTATPVYAWQGRIIQTQEGVVGTIAVRAAGLKDHPVVIHSGPWQSSPQLTGTKPELGDYSTEFGALATGEYIIDLVDLAQLKVTLEPGQFMLVEFRYELVKSSRKKD
ncbi:MAG: hypothetical protein U0401_31940 [Anaerolineae bacterium]